MSRNFRFAKVAAFIILLSMLAITLITPTLSVRQVLAKPSATKPKKKDRTCTSCSPRGNQEIYIPLIDLPESQTSELVFNSRSPETMSVTPVFYKRHGESVIADTVQINSAEIRYVKIKDLLPQRYQHEHEWGGFALTYYGTNREMWSQFRFMGVNGGGNVDEFFTVKDESRSSVYDAAWWMPDKSEVILALGNISDAATSATVNFGNGHARNVNLQPHATELVREEYRRAGSESAHISVTGASGSVVPTGLITTKDGKFNSVIRFYDPTKAKQPNLYANGFRVKGTTPHMVLKNTTESSIAVLPKIIPLSGSSSALRLSQVSLSANETKEVELSELTQAANHRTDLDVASVEIENWAAPGSVIGSLYTINDRFGLDYEIPLRDSGAIRSMTGAYPWKIDGDYKSVAYVTNITDDATEFVVELAYDGGKFTLGPRKLQPRETAVFDLAKIRDEQQKDMMGHALPLGVTQGQLKWAVRGVTNGRIVLIGRTEMLSGNQHISSSYSCPMDCGPSYEADATIPDELGITYSGSASVTETASWNYGYTMGPYPAAAGWEVDSPVASFDPSSGSDTNITGTDVGTATVSAVIGWQQRYDWDGLECVGLGSYLEEAVSEIGIGPVVATVQPSSAAPGTLVPVAIAGFGFRDGSTVSVSGGGIEVTEVRVVTSVLIVATFSVSPVAIPGTYSVGVTSAGRHSLFNGVFHVRIPDHLIILTDTANTAARNDCGDLDHPIVRGFVFRVVDDHEDTVDVVTVKEHFSSLSFNTCYPDGHGPSPSGCDYAPSVAGEFPDVISVGCFTFKGTCGYTITGEYQWCTFGGFSQTLGTFSETVHYDQITVNGNTTGLTIGSRF